MSAHTYARIYAPMSAELAHNPDAHHAARTYAQGEAEQADAHVLIGPPEIAHLDMPPIDYLIFPVMREVRS